MKIGIAAFLACLLSAIALGGQTLSGVLPTFPLLALAALALEWRAVALGWGFFSAAPAVYLGLALAGGFSAQAALFVAIAALLIRCLARDMNPAALLADYLPIAAVSAVARYHSQPFVLLDVYLLTSLLIPGWLVTQDRYKWEKVRGRMRGLWLATALLGWVATRLDGWSLAALLPTLACLQFAADRALAGYWAQERDDLRGRLERSWREVEMVREERQSLEHDLTSQRGELLWKEEIQRALGRCRNRPELGQALFRMADSLLSLRSSALLEVDQDGSWTLLAGRSPESARLESSRLLGLTSPFLVAAKTAPQEGPGILTSERQATAFPLDNTIVAYLGSASPQPWSEQQKHLLSLLAQAARANWATAAQWEMLSQQAGGSMQLRQRVELLEQLLLAASRLTSGLEPDQLILQLLAALETIPGEHRQILLIGQALPAIAQAVLETGKPLLLEDARAGRLALGEWASLLAVPIPERGVLLVGARQPGIYQREHQDWLMLLGYLAAQALENSQLHARVVEALQAQKESEAQLIQSSKMAAVGQLAAGVAHELNTPLGTIVLGIQSTLRKQPENPLLKTSLEAASQAKEIVSKLLFYSRDARLARLATDLNQVVRDTLQMLNQHLRLDNVAVELALGELPEIRVNQNEIQQVITNLVLNARDALLESSQRVIRIETESLPRGVVLRVIDHGPGIPPDLASRIFEPFFTTKPVGKGTGLGLSVSQQIVQAHGGMISLEARPQETCFSVLLQVEAPPPGNERA